MLIKTDRFGEIEINEENLIEFPEGLPGLEDLKKFILLSHQKNLPIKFLQSVEDGTIAVVVINSYLYMPEYSFNVPEEVFSDLKITDTKDVVVMTVVVIPNDIRKMTGNFAAPIILNTKNNKAKQIILQEMKYEIRQPIFDLFQNVRTGEVG